MDGRALVRVCRSSHRRSRPVPHGVAGPPRRNPRVDGDDDNRNRDRRDLSQCDEWVDCDRNEKRGQVAITRVENAHRIHGVATD